MSDTPNNLTPDEASTLPVENNEAKDDSTFESTIFTKHVYETKKPTNNGNKKRLIICIVAGVLCASIISSIFLVNRFLPNDNDQSSSTMSVLDEEIYTVLKKGDIIKPSKTMIDGKEYDIDTNIKAVHVVNGREECTLLNTFIKAKQDKVSDKTSSSESSTASASSSDTPSYEYDTFWYVKDIDKGKIVSSSILETIEECLSINAFREMKNDFDSVEEYHEYYGMDQKLTAGMVVEFYDSTEKLQISVGASLASGEAYYFMTSLSDTVYVINSDYAQRYFFTVKEFADPEIVRPIVKTDDNSSYFNKNEELARFDKIKVTGDVFGGKVYEFKMNTGGSADYMPYKMTAPYNRPADNSFIAEILGFATDGLSATELYSYSATDKELEEYGFNNPKGIIELTVGGYSYKLKIGGSMNDGSESMTAMVDDKTQVFGISQDDLSFLINASNDVTKMFSQKFVMEDIYTIKSLEIGVSDGKYRFDLKHTPRDEEKKVFDTEVKLGNTVMETQSFKYLYQRVLMLSLLDFVLEAEDTEPLLTITFNYIEDSAPRVVTFTESKDDPYHYIVWVDGTPLGEVLKSSVTDIIDCLDTYLKGGTITDTF